MHVALFMASETFYVGRVVLFDKYVQYIVYSRRIIHTICNAATVQGTCRLHHHHPVLNYNYDFI